MNASLPVGSQAPATMREKPPLVTRNRILLLVGVLALAATFVFGGDG